MAMKYLQLPVNFGAMLENLSDEQAGKLVKAMLDLYATGEEPNFLPGTPMFYLWPVCRRAVEDSISDYEHICVQNRENGKKGGRPPKKEKIQDLDFANLDDDL